MCPQDDLDPHVLKNQGFKHLDRVINLCANRHPRHFRPPHRARRNRTRTGTAMLAPTMANYWIHKDFQNRMIWLWTEPAKHDVGERVDCVVQPPLIEPHRPGARDRRQVLRAGVQRRAQHLV